MSATPDLCVGCSSPLLTFVNLQVVRDEKHLRRRWAPVGGCTCLIDRADPSCLVCNPPEPRCAACPPASEVQP